MSSVNRRTGRIGSGRHCSRSSCARKATLTLTYIYADSIAVVGPLATYSEPHAYDLCEIHGAKLTVPNGWEVIRREPNGQETGPSEDDLMEIANAVREVALNFDSNSGSNAVQSEIGRRGHLRSVPSSEN